MCVSANALFYFYSHHFFKCDCMVLSTLDEEQFLICIFYLGRKMKSSWTFFNLPSNTHPPVSFSVWYLGMLWSVDCDCIAAIAALSHSLWIHLAFPTYQFLSLTLFSIKNCHWKMSPNPLSCSIYAYVMLFSLLWSIIYFKDIFFIPVSVKF